MSDTDLEKFLPKLGDRIAVRQYCSREKEANFNDGAICKATLSLMDKIRGKKRKLFGGKSKCSRAVKLNGNTNAVSQKRRFEIGWKDLNEKGFTQVRQQRGGGTRHLTLNKAATMSEIKDIGTKLFFPNGKSMLGKVEEFEVTLRDHQDETLDPALTLLEVIERFKLKMLRIYICTKRVEESDDVPGSSSNTTTHTVPASLPEMPQTTEHSNGSEQSNIAGSSRPSIPNSETFLGPILLSSDDEVLFGGGLLDDDMFHDTLPYEFLRDDHETSRNTSTPASKIEKLKFHRGHVFKELNAAVQNCTITANDPIVEVEMILPNGTVEKGEDNGGVLRDALTEYWETFQKNVQQEVPSKYLSRDMT